jgi:hypothetical protein
MKAEGRREHKVPPLRFAPVGMTGLFGEFVGQHISIVSWKYAAYSDGLMKAEGRREHKVPPLRFAPVGMTDLFSEFKA